MYTTNIQPKKADNYETPARSLDMLLGHLKADKHFIWEPFRGSGRSTIHMRGRGFQVTNGDDLDFFKQTLPVAPAGMKLILVSNPPFSIKKEILEHLEKLGMYDMALLLPAPVMFTKYFHSFAHRHHVQMIVHTKRCAFLDPVSGESGGPASFDVAWICVGVGLERDITFPVFGGPRKRQ